MAWNNGLFPVLSELGQEVISVECLQCDRRGRFRADRLLTKFGDISRPEVMTTIAADAGCARAVTPPAVNDINYNDRRCQIRSVQAETDTPPALGTAINNGWRLFVICERRRAGLKSVKPCRGAVEMDLRTLLAAFGPNAALDEVGKMLKGAPCCGSKHFRLSWQMPDGRERSTVV